MKLGEGVRFYDYYWGHLAPDGPSFRQDINHVVPDERKRSSMDDPKDAIFLLPLLFDDGPASYIKDRHREFFLISLYFTALIDQGLHHYHREHHGKYDRLTAPPKLCTTIDNVYPNFIFQEVHGWPGWSNPRINLFKEAEGVFYEGFLKFAGEHLLTLDAAAAWEKFRRHLPREVLDHGL